jgi:hypothetical protein
MKNTKRNPPAFADGVFALVEARGIDLRFGAGRVAALACHRHAIHYRSRSIPP